MELKDRVAGMRFAHRDVQISLDGALVMDREQAMADLANANAQLRAARRELSQAQSTEGPDDRLGKGSSDPELEQAVDEAEAALAAAHTHLAELEERMREDLVTFRVTAITKDRFRELQVSAGGDPTKTYSLLARECVRWVNPEGEVEQISVEVWDELEPAMTQGQWAVFVDAIDEVNITLGRNRLDFLGRGSLTTRS